MIRAQCEKCGKVVQVPDNFAGGEGKCKRCGWRVYIPRPGEAGHASHAATPAQSRGNAAGAFELADIAAAASGSAPASPAGTPRPGEAPRPRTRPRKKDDTLTLVIAGLVVFALIVLVGVAIWAARRHQRVLDNPKEIRVPREEGVMRWKPTDPACGSDAPILVLGTPANGSRPWWGNRNLT